MSRRYSVEYGEVVRVACQGDILSSTARSLGWLVKAIFCRVRRGREGGLSRRYSVEYGEVVRVACQGDILSSTVRS